MLQNHVQETAASTDMDKCETVLLLTRFADCHWRFADNLFVNIQQTADIAQK